MPRNRGRKNGPCRCGRVTRHQEHGTFLCKICRHLPPPKKEAPKVVVEEKVAA